MRALRALDKGLGLQGASNRLSAIAEADAVLVFGADPTAESPAVEWQIRKALNERDAGLVVANMRRIHLDPVANCHLGYRPGSEIALAKGLGRLLLDGGFLDLEQLEKAVANVAELKADLAGVDLGAVVEETGLSLDVLQEAATIIGAAQKVAVIFGGDITRSAYGTSKSAVMANLAILTGALFHGGGLYPLDEKGNMQGVLDMGVCPESLPGYQDYSQEGRRFADAWQCTLPSGGLDAEGILQEIESGKIRLLYLAGVNPQSFPNSGRWLKALEKVEVLVVQDLFPSAASRLATIVLPATSTVEKAGRYTSLDHRVSVLGKAIKNVGNSRSDWDILAALYERLTESKPLTMTAVNDEIAALTDLYTDSELVAGPRPYRQKALYRIPETGLKYQLISVNDEAEGLQLLTGASKSHFGTTSTWASAPLEVEPECLISLNPADAERLAVKAGDVVKLTSASGTVVGKTELTEAVPPGLLFAPYNFSGCTVQTVLPDSTNRTTVEVVRI